MIGGLGSPYGAVFGALVVRGIPDLVHFNNDWVVPIGTGVLLIVVIVRARAGIAGLFSTVREQVISAVDDVSQSPPSSPTAVTKT
jgi:ABC-type branched-subunit amino acid transport system permease subunit